MYICWDPSTTQKTEGFDDEINGHIIRPFGVHIIRPKLVSTRFLYFFSITEEIYKYMIKYYI